MLHEDVLLDRIGAVYQAASDPTAWTAVLRSLAETIRARSASMDVVDFTSNAVSGAYLYNVDPAFLRTYSEYYLGISPYRSLMKDSDDRIYESQGELDERILVRSEFYNDWLRPQRVHYHTGMLFQRNGSRAIHLDFQRSKVAGPWDREHLELLRRLKPHVIRATQLNRQFAALQQARRAAEDVLDHLRMGVILVDANARPVFVNRAARALAATGDGLRLSRDRVDAEEPEESRHLARLIGEAARTANGEGLSPAGQVTVTRGSDGSGLHVLVSPLWPRALDVEGVTPRAALFVADPARGEPVAEELLQARFGLTPAESRLAGLLAQGRGLHEIAEAVGVTRETARSQLKSVFAKTGVRRQAELVRLVLEGAVRVNVQR